MAGRPSMSTVIEVDNLRKTYGDVVAIDGVSFQVRQGEIFGMVGPNGAGKTTTIECIEGLRRPDGGSARLLGLDPAREQRQVADRIGIQLQDERQVDLAGLLDRMGLVNQPEVVFFDELTTGLDPQARRSMFELVTRVRDSGCTVVLKGLWFGTAWSEMLLETAALGGTLVVCALLTVRFFCWE